MGTFKIRPTQLVQGGSAYISNVGSVPVIYNGWYNAAQPTDGFTIIQIIRSLASDNKGPLVATVNNNPSPISFNDTLRFSFTGNSIYLDGSLTPIDFFSLPAGFTPLTATLDLHPSGIATQPFAGSSNFYLQFGTLTEGLANISSFSYSSPPTSLDLINNGCGIRVAIIVSDIGDLADVEIQELVLTGTYGIASSQFTLQNPTTPIYVGSKIKVFSNSEANDPGNFTHFSQVKLDFVADDGFIQTIFLNFDSYYFIVWQQPELWFYLPRELGHRRGKVTITLIGDGIQFTGSVVLGTLDVLYEDASGIYSLVKGQTDDVLYFREGYTTDTQEIMLPDMMNEELFVGDDFFNMLPFPRRILAQNDLSDDYETPSDLSVISSLRTVIVAKDTEIPSPFIKTAFLP